MVGDRWQASPRHCDPAEVWKTSWANPEEVIRFYETEWWCIVLADAFADLATIGDHVQSVLRRKSATD